MFDDERKDQQYPNISKYSSPLRSAERVIVGRDEEIKMLMASLSRPELCNPLLLGNAGAGKTALVQGAALVDTNREYREVDLSKMINDLKNPDEMASRIKSIFDESSCYVRDEGVELVLFMDEFHQIVQLSPAAVEALKPGLAASGALGVRIIAATTYDEFHQFISPNQALVERLQRMNLTEPDHRTTISILRGMAEKYKVLDLFHDDSVFEMIYEYSNRYIPASSQPRKSILLLDSMVGWHRTTGRPMNRALLADVIMQSTGVNVAFRVDAAQIEARLNAKVLSQKFATKIVSRRLQMCVADLNDNTKPMSSFLLTGSTGVGKTEITKQLAQLLFGDAQRHFIRFDMTEFSSSESVELFKSELSKRVWDRPFSVILLDEIEKASPMVTRALLPILDDGRMTDDNNRQVSFLNSYIVMTTNAGSEVYKTIAQYEVDDEGSGARMSKYHSIIRQSLVGEGGNKFPPELLGRIDEIVPMQPLSRTTQREIVRNKLIDLNTELRTKHNVLLYVDSRVLDYLVEDKGETESDSGGARNAIGRLSREVVTEVAVFINAHPQVRSVRVDVLGELVKDNPNIKESDARIVVTPVHV